MRILFHQWLCPHSRKIRLGLAEKRLDFQLQVERPWEKRAPFLEMNPIGSLPVLIEEDGIPIIHHQAITEFLEEAYPESSLTTDDILQRAEIRRIMGWIDDHFYQDVWIKVVFEKVYKRHYNLGYTNSQVLREGSQNIHTHLKRLEELLEQRHWLAGTHLTWADLSASAMLSTLDYLGDIPWNSYPETKNWYARLKSRPCFRALLTDLVPGLLPASHYANLDF